MAKREAVSLTDIALRTENVDISEEVSLKVRGLPSKTIKDLLVRYPQLRGVILGGNFKAAELVQLSPEIIGALCAAATGELGNEEAEQQASELPVETQLDILEALGRCTFSKGFGPFAHRVAVIAAQLFGPAGRAQDTSSPPPSKSSEEQPTPPSGT